MKQLSKLRRVGTTEFKGQVFINIREYYEDKATGDHKPGKKVMGAPFPQPRPLSTCRQGLSDAHFCSFGTQGISLTLDQYRRLVEVMPEINAVLAEQGHDAPDAPVAAEAAPAPKPKTKKSSTKQKKSNIEATSDEEGAGQDESDEE